MEITLKQCLKQLQLTHALLPAGHFYFMKHFPTHQKTADSPTAYTVAKSAVFIIYILLITSVS